MSSSARPIKILIAAGGTGGHIFPAVALGEAFARHFPDVVVDYVCGERELEKKLYADQGISPVVFPARHFGNNLASKGVGFFAAVSNTCKAAVMIRRLGYNAVVGMGGYVSGPAVLAGILCRRVTVIHEANSIPGKTNRYLAPWVSRTAVHFQLTDRLLKTASCAVVGMPIRESMMSGSKEQGMAHFELDINKTTLLVLGGSQGAKHLYQLLAQALPSLDAKIEHPLQMLWSTGAANYEELRTQISGLDLNNITVKLVPFINRMDLAMAAADVAVARAGASSMAELLSNGIYALYIPYPSAIYNHQALNAKEAVDAGAGLLLPEKELSAEIFAQQIHQMLVSHHGGKIAIMDKLNSQHAAHRLSSLIMNLVAARG